MFSRTVFKSICTAALTAGLLSSCALFERDADGEPSHSWVEGKNYYSYGDKDATLATVAYSQGDFKTAEQHVARALTNNPRHPQALMVGALVYEELGRPNRARQYYEDLMLVGGDENTLLGSPDGKPRKMSEIANQRLRLLNMNQTRMIIEDKDGNKVFNISGEAAARQGKSALEEALFIREQTRAANNRAVSEADVKAVEVLFTPEEQNTVSRFLILKELAENDMVTKEEFLNGRMANLGGLLPLTNTPPAYGVVKPVPSPDLILERIRALKEAVASRAITPREFSAERDLIIEAILPPHPRQRCGTASGRGDNGPVDRRPARQQAVEQFGVALLGEQFLDDFTPVENRHFYQRIADVDRQVHASCSLYNDFSISHAPAMSVTPLTVIAKRLLCCLSTNLSGRRVTRRNSSEKTSLL